MLSITEIVSSIQGEGKYVGFPTTFIRFYGCNNRCLYCDSLHAVTQKKRKKMSIDTICIHCFRMGNQHICITGGEPLIQVECMPLVYELQARGYIICIETNGSVEIDDERSRMYCYIMDIKCPSSGMSHKNCYENLERLRPNDEVKFVIADEKDYTFAKEVLAEYKTKANIIFSPCFGKSGNNAVALSEMMIDDKLFNVRLGVQVHKLIGIY